MGRGVLGSPPTPGTKEGLGWEDHWAPHLPFQQKPGEVLVAVEALREIHLDRGERPADAIWRARASEGPGRTPTASLVPSRAPGPAHQRDSQLA